MPEFPARACVVYASQLDQLVRIPPQAFQACQGAQRSGRQGERLRLGLLKFYENDGEGVEVRLGRPLNLGLSRLVFGTGARV